MFLTALLVVIVLFNWRFLSIINKKILILQTLFFLFSISLQLLFLSMFTGSYFVGSDSLFYANAGEQLYTIFISEGFFQINSYLNLFSYGTSYVFYILFNFLSYYPQEILYSMSLKFNNMLMTLIFLVSFYKFLQINNIKISKDNIIYVISLTLLFDWLIILNFRDNLIAVFIGLIFLQIFGKSNYKFLLLTLLSIGMYFLRSELVFIIAPVIMLHVFLNKNINRKLIIMSQILIFLIWYFIPLPDFLKGLLWAPVGDSGIHEPMPYEVAINLDGLVAGKQFVENYIIGMIYAFLANNPLSLILDYFEHPTGVSWYFTPLTNLLNFSLHLINIILIYPLILTLLLGKKEVDDKYSRNLYLVLFFVLTVYGFYAVKFGIQDRIRIPLHILIISLYIYKGNLNMYNKKLMLVMQIGFLIWIILKILVVDILGFRVL